MIKCSGSKSGQLTSPRYFHHDQTFSWFRSPFPLFLGVLEALFLLDEVAALSLMESCGDEVLPVVSLSRIMLS